jgi:uncharacterized protein involved in exopolysaccharide biosynthesis
MADQQTQSEGSQIDVFVILRLIRRNLLFFILAAVAALFVAYMVNRYAQEVYSISGQLSVSQDSRAAATPGNVLQDIPMLNQKPNVANERIILKSTKFVGQAVDRLNLPITYKKVGQVRNSVIYQGSPFKVVGKLKSNSLYETDIEVEILGKNRVRVSLPEEKSSKHHFDKTLRFGERYNNNALSFKVLRDKDEFPFNNASSIANTFFKFHFNKRENLISSFKSSLSIGKVGERTSVISISLNSPVRERAKDFIDALMKTYIQNVLEQKSKVASNTIDFIDQQIETMSRSLSRAEDSLKRFQVENARFNLGGVSSGGGSGGGSSSGGSGQFFSKLTRIQSDIEKVKLQIKSLDHIKNKIGDTATLKNYAPTLISGSNAQSLSSALNKWTQLVTERKAMDTFAFKGSPTMNELDAKLQATKQTILNIIRSSKESLNLKLEEYRSRLSEVQRKITAMPRKQIRMMNLKRTFSVREEIYLYLLKKKSEAEIAQAATVSKSTILEQADHSGPIRPNSCLSVWQCLLAWSSYGITWMTPSRIKLTLSH